MHPPAARRTGDEVVDVVCQEQDCQDPADAICQLRRQKPGGVIFRADGAAPGDAPNERSALKRTVIPSTSRSNPTTCRRPDPPFSLDEWGREVAENDGHGCFRLGVPPKTKGDLAFVQQLFGRTTLDPYYLAHLAQWDSLTRHAVATSSGTKMPRTSWAQLGEFQFSLPPLAEQRKIAAILSSVNDAIEKTQAVIDQVQVIKHGLGPAGAAHAIQADGDWGGSE